jgi:hypothetical protein
LVGCRRRKKRRWRDQYEVEWPHMEPFEACCQAWMIPILDFSCQIRYEACTCFRSIPECFFCLFYEPHTNISHESWILVPEFATFTQIS